MAPDQSSVAGDSFEFLADLNNGDSKALLDTIDNLRELNVGDIVSLPQIIVVGDQSAGKSSVLEAISRVRFPIDAKLCTRFATELILRRSDESRVSASIRFSGNNKTSKPFQRSGFKSDALPAIIEEAKEHMGITSKLSGGQSKRFTNDVLRIEISRPDVCPLTLVDLPGIFRNETADQTMEDSNTVKQLVHDYLSQEKSIILAVVTATNQLANQEIVMMAKDHDPERKRTIGVITKPDLSQEKGVTQQFVDVVKGLDPTHKLSLGWFVLRNLSENQKLSDMTFDERDAREKDFFQTGSWSSIQSANRGVQSLRKALSKVLLERIKTNLPVVVQEIEDGLNRRREELKCFGQKRVSSDDLRSYLYDISKEFDRLAANGINGWYVDDFFDEEKDGSGGPRKLRANLRKLNRAFYISLKEKGETTRIVTSHMGISEKKKNGINDAEPDYLSHLIAQYERFPHPTPVLEAQFIREIESVAAGNQGRELPGVPSSDLAIHLFRKQSKFWRDIALFHLDLILKFSKSFVEDAFAHVIGDNKRTLVAVLNTYSDPFFENKRELLEAKLDEILRPYTEGSGLPMEVEFRETLNKTAQLRFGKKVVSTLEKTYPEIFNESKPPTKGLSRLGVVQSILTAAQTPNSEFGTESVVDMMLAYYDVSFTDFILFFFFLLSCS